MCAENGYNLDLSSSKSPWLPYKKDKTRHLDNSTIHVSIDRLVNKKWYQLDPASFSRVIVFYVSGKQTQ